MKSLSAGGGIAMRTAAIAAGVYLTMTSNCFAQTSVAMATRYNTQITPQSLESALKQFGKLDHIHVLYLTADVKDIRTGGASGELTRDQTLDRLLNETGLTYRYVGVNAVSIIPVSRNNSTAGRPSHSMEKPKTKKAAKVNSGRDLTTGQEKEEPQNSSHRSYLTEVRVTGTRIEGAAPVGVTVQTISSVDIERSGYTTLDEVLNSLPDSFRGGAAGAIPDALFSNGANSGANISFGSGVNLRGLGNTATLVLVDGHRMPSSGEGYYTDISGIPLSAIDHIEVLTDGASAIYGTDAVAGVVDIILKRQSDGLYTTARYGIARGFSQYDGTVQLGQQWGDGGFTLDADYLGQRELDVMDRQFTSSVTSPTSLIPMSHRISIFGAGNERFGQNAMVLGDFEYSNRYSLVNAGVYQAQSIIDVPTWSGSLTGRWQTPSSWMMSMEFSGGEGTEDATTNMFATVGAPTLLDGLRDVSRFSEFKFDATGGLVSLPGGTAKLAAGASYMIGDYSLINTNNLGDVAGRYGARRDVESGYVELLVPIVGTGNAAMGMAGLALSAAGRYDRYSDFGGTTNYKIGISWYPTTDVQLRSAYSTSFRAPAIGTELVDSNAGTTGLLLDGIYNPAGTAMVPVLFEEGAIPGLKPETATNLTIGVDYKSTGVSTISLSVDYYRIIYKGQIASAPFEEFGLSDPALQSVISRYSTSSPIEALVSEALANGVPFYDSTGGQFGPNPLTDTEFLYDVRLANLSRTETSGFDLLGRDQLQLGKYTINTAVDATYISTFVSQLTPSAKMESLIDTVGYPAKLRTSAQLAVTRGRCGIALTGNFVGSYTDTSTELARRVGSYTTMNVSTRCRLPHLLGVLSGASVSVAAANVLNRQPPYVTAGSMAIPDSHYDAANASPIGRLISVEIDKQW